MKLAFRIYLGFSVSILGFCLLLGCGTTGGEATTTTTAASTTTTAASSTSTTTSASTTSTAPASTTTTAASSTSTTTGTTSTTAGATSTTIASSTTTTTVSTTTTTPIITTTSTSTTTTSFNPATFTIAFTVYDNLLQNPNVYTMTADGNNRTQLTSSGDSTYPLFNPTKSKILYTKANTNTYIMNADGATPTLISNGTSVEIEHSVSPDGNTILFSSNASGTLQVWRMAINGSARTQVTNLGNDTWGPKFLPNGSQFLFASDFATGSSTREDIYIANINGTGITRLTSSEGIYNNYYPTISQNGTKFAYYSSGLGNSDVWIRNIDGSGAINLSNTGYASSNGEPSISYDGTKVVFHSNRSGSYEVYSVNIDGTGLTQLTSIGANFKPQSLPNEQILFLSNRDGKSQIYLMNNNGGNQIRLFSSSVNDGDNQPLSPEKPSF